MSFWTKFKRRTRNQAKTSAAAVTSLADLVITEAEKTAAASNATSTTVGVTDDIIEDANGRQFTINEKGVWQKVRSDAQVADPTGQSGKYLTTDGVNTSWGTVDLSTRLSTSGGTLTGDLTLNSAVPRINFNGTSDAGIDMAIKATPEGLDFFEPEDSDKVHFQIIDDGGVNSPYGYQWNGQSLDARYAAASHTHSYLPLSGGTVTGNLTVNGDIIGDELRVRTNQDLTITCGESFSSMSDATYNDEFVRIAGEMGVKVFASSNNLTSGLNRETTLVDTSGNLTAAGNVTAYSDIRLKDNIEVITNAVEKVQGIRGVTYTLKDELDGTRYSGVIAQEVEAVLPEVVGEDSNGTKTVAYGNVVGLLIEAIKELKAEIDELKGSK